MRCFKPTLKTRLLARDSVHLGNYAHLFCQLRVMCLPQMLLTTTTTTSNVVAPFVVVAADVRLSAPRRYLRSRATLSSIDVYSAWMGGGCVQ